MEYKKKDGISGVYIVFEIDCASEESVEAKMLQNNNICGLLACDFRYEDNRTYIYYDTTDKMAVSDIMKEGKMTYDILKEISEEFKEQYNVEFIKKYLEDPNQIPKKQRNLFVTELKKIGYDINYRKYLRKYNKELDEFA